jgi:gamma-glutamyltranspeptidase/glutathione hydrolase
LLIVCAGILAALLVVVAILPRGPRDPMDAYEPFHQPREAFRAQEFIVVAGTPEAAAVMYDVLAEGGNAVDAAIAGLLTINVTFGDAASFPGIAPTLVWDAEARSVQSYIGAGTAPARATIEEFRRRWHPGWVIPPSIDAQLVPASPDVIVALLRRHGSRSFTSLATPAIRIAEEGFPLHPTTVKNVGFVLPIRLAIRLLRPYTARVWTQDAWWRPLVAGDRFRRPDLANGLRVLADAETSCLDAGGTRDACLVTVRDAFYRGPLADAIVALHEEQDGLMSRQDLAGYAGRWEEPLRGRFRGYDVLTNGTWTQGIVVPMVLQMLDGLPLESLEHNSAKYVHTVVQALELAMADREAYVGDPAFVDVPIATLLHPAYAATRRAAMTDRAFGRLPEPGAAGADLAWRPAPRSSSVERALSNLARIPRDTSYLAVIDAAGNSVSMTPSDFPVSPMVPGVGLTLGIRMTQFKLDPASPTALEPGKRPRVTPHALMLVRDGEHVMSIGTPGGEMQTQANTQVLLNHLVFGMDLQEAIEAPRFRCRTWPDSFSPHVAEPGVVELEATLHDAIADELAKYGYEVRQRPDWDNLLSAVGAVRHQDGALVAGADPRESTLAAGR